MVLWLRSPEGRRYWSTRDLARFSDSDLLDLLGPSAAPTFRPRPGVRLGDREEVRAKFRELAAKEKALWQEIRADARASQEAGTADPKWLRERGKRFRVHYCRFLLYTSWASSWEEPSKAEFGTRTREKKKRAPAPAPPPKAPPKAPRTPKVGATTCGPDSVPVKAYCRKRSPKKKPTGCLTRADLESKLTKLRRARRQVSQEIGELEAEGVEAIAAQDGAALDRIEAAQDEKRTTLRLVVERIDLLTRILDQFERLPTAGCLDLQAAERAYARQLRAVLRDARERGLEAWEAYRARRVRAEAILDDLKRARVNFDGLDSFSRFDRPAQKRKLAVPNPDPKATDAEELLAGLVRRHELPAALTDRDPEQVLAELVEPALEKQRHRREFFGEVNEDDVAELDELRTHLVSLIAR